MVKHINREKLANNKFLSNLQWSAWQPALATRSPKDDKESWEECRGDITGVRNVNLFSGELHKPAMYEVGIQTPGETAKHAVLYKVTEGLNQGNLETYLLRQPRLQSQADRILRRGCKLHVRRALWKKPVTINDNTISSLDELKQLMSQTYDYAWRDRYDCSSRRYIHRGMQRDSVIISDNV